MWNVHKSINRGLQLAQTQMLLGMQKTLQKPNQADHYRKFT